MILAETTHWLQRLHLISAPQETTLQSAELRLRGLLPFWLAGVFLVLGIGYAIWLYWRENPRPRFGSQLLLITLRSMLIALVLALLLRPVLLAEFAGARARSVVLLIDTSESMVQADRRVSDADRVRLAIAKGLIPANSVVSDTGLLKSLSSESLADLSRIEMVREIFKSDKLDLLNRLKETGPLQVFFFDKKLTSVEGEWSGKLQATTSQTALADSLVEVLTRLGPEPPAAVVLVTDGQDNISKRTLDEAAKLYQERGVPLHIYGVGSSEAGVLQIKDVRMASTLFIDPKSDGKDDPFDVTVRYRFRGVTRGTVVLTVALGDQVITQRFAVEQGENLVRRVRFVDPKKGKEGDRPVKVSMRLEPEQAERPVEKPIQDEVNRQVAVKNSRVKILVVENSPRREYHFLLAALNRDRRVLMRVFLAEGDSQLQELAPDAESGSVYLDKFPENFPEPHAKDPDRRSYDLVILGDLPYGRLGEDGGNKLARFVREGGGLVVMAGKNYAPAEYGNTPLAEALPVEFTRQEFSAEDLSRLTAFRPGLTYDGEQATVMSLADTKEESVNLWKEDLWKNTPGFEWFYPVGDLRPGATALLVHPERKVGRQGEKKPMALIASHYYGKGETLFIGTDETWRWRDSTGDRLTARFWGQVVARYGLPHLLGAAKRTQLELETGEPILGRPGTVRARLLDARFEPITRDTVQATLVNVSGKTDGRREVILRRVPGQPGEYRGALPNDLPGRHELRVTHP